MSRRREVNRLTKDADFQEVYKKGLSYLDHLLVVRTMPNSLPVSRFGYSVGRRIGNAVARNRVKRLLRESVHLENPVPGWDVVFIARVPAARAPFGEIHHSAHRLLERAKLLEHDKTKTLVSEESR